MNDVKLYMMEKIIVDVRGATGIMAVLLVVMYQVRWFLQHQTLMLCKKKQRKVWSFILKALWKIGKMFQHG